MQQIIIIPLLIVLIVVIGQTLIDSHRNAKGNDKRLLSWLLLAFLPFGAVGQQDSTKTYTATLSSHIDGSFVMHLSRYKHNDTTKWANISIHVTPERFEMINKGKDYNLLEVVDWQYFRSDLDNGGKLEICRDRHGRPTAVRYIFDRDIFIFAL